MPVMPPLDRTSRMGRPPRGRAPRRAKSFCIRNAYSVWLRKPHPGVSGASQIPTVPVGMAPRRTSCSASVLGGLIK